MLKGFRYLFSFCWARDKSYIVCLFIRQLLGSMAALSTVMLPKYIINAAFNQGSLQIAMMFAGTFVAVSALLTFLQNNLAGYTFKRKMQLFRDFQLYLAHISYDALYQHTESADYLNLRERAYKFVYGNGAGFGHALEQGFDLIGGIFTLVGIMGVVFYFHPLVLVFLMIVVLSTTYVEAKTKKKNIQENLEKSSHERRSSYLSNLFSDFRYGKEVRTYSIYDWLITKYEHQLLKMHEFYNRIANNNTRSLNISAAINLVQQTVMYTYIIFQAVQNTISIGDFTMYISAVISFTSTLKSAFSRLIDMQQYSAFYESFQEFVDMNKPHGFGKETITASTQEHTITFQNVSFRYPGQKRYALKNVSVTIKCPQKIFILGENGSGKSTFLKLLTRLYTPTEGEIIIDGVNIKDLSEECIHGLVKTVYQDYRLLSFTLKENILLGREENVHSFNDIITNSQLNQFIGKLPEGENTYIHRDFNSAGVSPSGGEAQRIAIARALYAQSPITILDEPTAALDPKAEYALYMHFDKFFKDRTVIYVSHRLACAAHCERILVFSDGNIVEDGTHQKLYMDNGQYRRLYDMQAEFFLSPSR